MPDIKPPTIRSTNTFGTAKIRVRGNLAIHHLRAAVHAAKNAYEVEQANLMASHGPWFDEMAMWVPVAVVMAGAALEANLNEIVQDVLDGAITASPAAGCKTLLKDMKKERSISLMAKYRRLALLVDKDPPIESEAWKDAHTLTELRNTFMHFKPAWDDEKEIHEGALVKKLKAKIPIYRASKENFLFPFGFLTYGCAKWSTEAVLKFSIAYSELLGIRNRFADKIFDFSLP